jgi:hypothetical protein
MPSTSKRTECTQPKTKKSWRELWWKPALLFRQILTSAILATQEAAHPSFILFRETNLLVARDNIDILLPTLPALEPGMLSGCVAVFGRGRLRVRKLPF